MTARTALDLRDYAVDAGEVSSPAFATGLSPSSWHQERVAGAVIDRGMDPDPPLGGNYSAYTPFPLRRGSDGRILCYVKEESPEFRLVLFDSADGEVFAHVGTALTHGAGGAWDETGVSEPAGYYDETTNTVHMLYKGWSGVAPTAKYHVGYATALASAPTAFTRQNGGNPILNQDTVATALGIWIAGVTNYCFWSEDLTNAAWTKFAATITSNAIMAPDGQVTADLVVPSVANSAHTVNQALPALANNTLQSQEFWAADAGYDWVQIRTVDKAGVTKQSWVNVATGATGTVHAGHTITSTLAEHGFYRFTVVWNSGTGATTPALYFYVCNGNNVSSFAGDGVKGVYLWGLQFELNTGTPSPYYAKSEGTNGVRNPNVVDHGITSVLKVDGAWLAYGYIATLDEGYRIYRASGASLTALVAEAIILSPPAGYRLAYFPCVFRHPSAPVYCMVYTLGVELGTQSRYHLRSAWSPDGLTWTPFRDWFSVPANWQDHAGGFEARHYAGRFVMSGYDGTLGGLGGYDRPLVVEQTNTFLYYLSFSQTPGDKVGVIKVRPTAGRGDAHFLRNTTKLTRTSVQAIPNNSWTDILFNFRAHIVLDDAVEMGAGHLEEETVTIRESGLYAINFTVSFAANATGQRQAFVVINGTATPAIDVRPSAGASVETMLRGTCIHQMAGGETVKLRVFQDSGGVLNLYLTNVYPTLEIRRVGD